MRWPVIVFGMAVAICALAQLAILASVIRRSSRIADSGVPRPRVGAEILWALLPALMLALVFTATWPRVREHADQPSELFKVAR